MELCLESLAAATLSSLVVLVPPSQVILVAVQYLLPKVR